MKRTILLATAIALTGMAKAQPAEELVGKIKTRINTVNDYEATGKMKTNVAFIKAPEANVKIYFKKPNKLRVKNETGISFIPKGAVNINLGNIFDNTGLYDIIDVGREAGTGYRIIKLLPKDDKADVVLSTLYIEENTVLVRKAKTTTRENGTYELEMEYGRYANYGLADKIVFSFNAGDYKLPKGVTFDYDDGTEKEKPAVGNKEKKGRVEISYSSYIINKGVPDSIFQ